jgi:FixJ family two-component response regulator
LRDQRAIAIVDDDESVREALVSLLKALGFEPEAFGGAEAFLGSAFRRRAACLITDMQMPGMSGLALHDSLAASPHPIPTVLITAYPDDTLRARAQKAGVAGYLIKPFDEEALLGCIQDALARRNEHGDAGAF